MNIRTATFWLCLLIFLLSVLRLRVEFVGVLRWEAVSEEIAALSERVASIERVQQTQGQGQQ